MSRQRRRVRCLRTAALGLVLVSQAAPSQERELRVLAAASLTEVVSQLGARFERARALTSFGASSALARQIADGAPADVFVSASPDWMDFLRERGALAGEPVAFARNSLVCITPRGSDLARTGVRDLASLFAHGLAPGDLVAIADAGVPAGEYARQSLAAMGVLAPHTRRLVGRSDVRAVLQSVEAGEAQAGFVYATDARLAEVDVLFRLDPGTHAAIVLLAAVTRDAREPELARSFVESLRGAAAREVLARAGFLGP